MTPRRYAWGPQALGGDVVSFRLWAPKLSALSVELGGRLVSMQLQRAGWFGAEVDGVGDGASYMFVLPDGTRVPDPASRFQADVSGPSTVCTAAGFDWENKCWRGRAWEESVVYEIHIGTFTANGTFEAAIEHLPRLSELGFTAIEIMPLAHFPGSRGWGYDGVFHYAPHSAYGTPDDFRRFVDIAHGHGLMVFLDVVYNHFGPAGNCLPQYAPEFFRKGAPTPWGDKIDFEREPVRHFFIDSVIYWLGEFQLDGLRLDAVDQMEDDSDRHILQEISETVRDHFPDRHVHLITENPANGTDLLADLGGGRRLFVADWNDDFHHAVHVAATGESGGYYEAFRHDPWTKVKKALAEGYLQQGKRLLRIEPPPTASLPAPAFVHFLQNHDQVGNRALGDRLHTIIGERCHKVLTEILALSPQIPLFFMGDDHLSERRFHFFTDFEGELARAVAAGRRKEAANFGGLPKGYRPEDTPDPNDLATFENCKIIWDEAGGPIRVAWASFLQRLFEVRRKHVVPLLASCPGYAGRVLPSDDDAIYLDWKLNGRVLRLRANCSEHVRILDEGLGRLVYPTPAEVASAVLLPWATHLFVA